ncbi:Pfs domain protein [Aspergillus alliaceus]|uniref:Pfs domain protein n=1 Tax=Petromyces alliaceus TaxID=209559 RepID=UPI0012A46734|nr:uncharacterized protein BDW43DRAFT_321490 [Aspergillus alliaceus]KAB8230345.1 hypothetical protein BDW43DRAFT_321490 [Aspergillus alliaceus]
MAPHGDMTPWTGDSRAVAGGSSDDKDGITSEDYIRSVGDSRKVTIKDGEGLRMELSELEEYRECILAAPVLADGTITTAWVDPSKIAEKSLFCVEVVGAACSIIDLGEQFAWIGASLRSSPHPQGVSYSRPIVQSFKVFHDNSQSNGQCWHNQFRNPVMGEGYPIARRSHPEAANDLDIPFYTMAILARSRYVNKFAGKTVIKGFSTMLVPTRQYGNVILWHLVHDQHGDRVSYLESLVMHTEEIRIQQRRGARHVLGWCLEAMFLAGTMDAKYDIRRSRLPRTGADCLLQKTSVSGGQMITGGLPFSIGYKDSPYHVSRSGYIRKLKWISRKFIVLWDEESKQGWLVNGTSAPLHLVRASLAHNSNDKFASEFLFRNEDMQEATQHSYKYDSAISVLLSRVNRELKIYLEKHGYVLFEDRVEHQFNILEQIIDHQVSVAGHNDTHYRSNNIPRAHLEGWDFHDLAKDAWIEFTRSIHAVTVLGRGFGEIMKPANTTCSHVADLMDIMESIGDATASPPKLTKSLDWQNPETAFAHCGCTGDSNNEHIDVVQVILPPGTSDASPMEPHRNKPLHWKYTVDPVRGKPQSLDRVCLSPSMESDGVQFLEFSVTPSSQTSVSIPTASVTDRLSAKSRFRAVTTNKYTVGIVCALTLELLAVRALFDVTHTNSDGIISHEDSNHYALGEIGKHRVVAACLPEGEYGTNSAAYVAANLRRTFPGVKFALLVGIGGGVPSPANDIRLVDVIVSRPAGSTTGLIMTAGSNLRSDPHLSACPLQERLDDIIACRREYKYPGKEQGQLFNSDYVHDSRHATCDSWDVSQASMRAGRPNSHPHIHYDTIASGNRVVRNAKLRDRWSQESNVLCFEMEAAGIMNTLPCLVIRGICDYSDSHKSKGFQEYAAATAASYAKLLLSYVEDLNDLGNVGSASDSKKQLLPLRLLKKGHSFFGR